MIRYTCERCLASGVRMQLNPRVSHEKGQVKTRLWSVALTMLAVGWYRECREHDQRVCLERRLVYPMDVK
jgi:hypothetical protein